MKLEKIFLSTKKQIMNLKIYLLALVWFDELLQKISLQLPSANRRNLSRITKSLHKPFD